ncbi:PREDICTED: apolipoprotein B receptor isoform X2 [Hipposideros armiger]|uniref:Apolipoprotein B receptor isoform X2 n=1 Tax=Hipposideros armiger TaxID=186990 RepID=A0A8B7RTG4_HIPAR|nr:PREDICTED: apolipoprotein B receptor isoform X2 [Hipposideros armiger]
MASAFKELTGEWQDSFSTFVSYLIGDEVPTAERREAHTAEELREVAAGRPRRTVEEEAQEALEGLGDSQSKGNGELREPGEASSCQEGSSATEQTWAWGEGSSRGSQAERQDTGVWEVAKASRCQEPSAPVEARKESRAGSETGGTRNSQAQESQEHNEQEVNRKETLRTWEQEEEEEEEVRAREPVGAGGVESEWTWHKEPERKAHADWQKVAGIGRELETATKEAVAEETQEPGVKEPGREEEVVVVVRDGQSTTAQGTQEPGEESEGGATLGREEARTTSDEEEAWTISVEEEAWTTSGREEAGTTSCREEARTTSDEEAAWTMSGREEAETTSYREEARTTSDEEAWTMSGREEAGTTSGGEEAGTMSNEEEAETTSGREKADLPGVGELECGAVPGDRIPEGTGRVWALEKASKGDQENEVDEKREAEVSLFLKQTQALETEGVEEAAKDQTAGREDAGGQRSEGEVGVGLESQADQGGKEAKERPDTEIRAAQASLEEVLQPQEAKEEKQSCPAVEGELPPDKVANEAEGEAVLEATPEDRPEKEFREKRSEEEAQIGREALGVERGGLEHRVTEAQELELRGGPQIPTEQPEEGQRSKEEPWDSPPLSKEGTERSLEEYPGNMEHGKLESSEAEAWESWRRRDVERRDTQEEEVGTEEREEAAAGGPGSALPEVLEVEREGEKAKEGGGGAESPELGGKHRAEAGAGQSLEEPDARKTQDEEVEAAGPWEADSTSGGGWRLEGAALSLQDREDTWASSLAAEIVEDKAASDGRAAGTGEEPKRGAGEAWDGAFGRGCDLEGREETGRGKELVEAAEGENRGGKEFGLESSAEEEVTGRDGQAEAFEAREREPGGEWTEAGESAVAEGSWGIDGFTSGSQAARAEGTMAIVEAEGLPGAQTLVAKEAEVWQTRGQGQGSEGQRGDHDPEEEAHMPCDAENVELTGRKREEANEIDPEGLEDAQSQEDQSTNQDPAEAEPELHGEAAGSADEDAHGIWNEALIPGSRLDLSVPRSRILLSRSSSQRRSRPSFRRTPTPEQQAEPPSPPPEEGLSALRQTLLQSEDPPEPSPPRPDGTPVPARKRPPGYGFGLAHPGMMQELQARLGRPKPQ